MLGDIYLRLHKAGMLKFDELVKKQKAFWCPFCDVWHAGKKLESAVGHMFFNKENKMTVAAFGVCEPCLAHAGKYVAAAAHLAITERMAKRAGAGITEKFDPRIKSIMLTEDEVPA